MLILLGWIVGLAVGVVTITAMLLAFGATLPGFLNIIVGVLTPLVATLTPWFAVMLAIFFLVAGFLVAYLIATASIAPTLPTATGLTTITFPPPSGTFSTTVAVTIPATPGEFFARGALIGLSAAINSIPLSLVPRSGVILAVWAFVVISLAAVIFVARNRIYQGLLGWSGWLFPLSYLATGVGLLLFIVNLPFAFATLGLGAFAIDWTTGVIETTGGVTGITGFGATAGGGFSLGNFNFIVPPLPPTPFAPGTFTTPSLRSHETGHSLNTAAFGGVVLWINAIDENIAPGRMNLAYGELTAEGHARNMSGAPPPDFSLRLWF